LAEEVYELSQQHKSLETEVSGLSAQLRKSSSHISTSLTAETIAIRTAQKLSEIMPILADTKASRNWLSSQGLNGFLGLSDLAVQDDEKAPNARKVAKICIQISKLIGHCKAGSGLGRYMGLKLEKDMSGCLMLVKYLKKIYKRTCEDPMAKVLFMEIVGRMQDNLPTFEAAASLIAHLSDALPALPLAHFSKSLFSYLEEPDEATSTWLSSLHAVAVNWTPDLQATALACIQSLLYATAEQQFPRACLYLTELLISKKVNDMRPLIQFILNCSEAIKCGNRHVYSLIFKLHGLIVSNDQLIEAAICAMKHFTGASATTEQISLLICALGSVAAGHYSSLEWLYTDWTSAGEALGLLGLILETETLEEAIHSAEQLLTAFASSLTAEETAICLKLANRLYKSKRNNRSGLLFSLTSLVQTPLSSFFLKDLAAIPEENASPEQLADSSKLLNLVRKYPTEDIITAARHLAALIGQLRIEGVTAAIFTKELKLVLKQRTVQLRRLSAVLKPMVKSEPASAHLAMEMLELLAEAGNENVHLMLFVPEMITYLAARPVMPAEAVISFAENVLIKCFKVKNYTLLRILKNQLLDIDATLPLVDLIRRSKSALSIVDVYELNLLPNVKLDCIQVYDCMRGECLSVPLKQSVKVDTSSSFVFVDDGSIFCCGGEY
jgi:hypothetical protein